MASAPQPTQKPHDQKPHKSLEDEPLEATRKPKSSESRYLDESDQPNQGGPDPQRSKTFSRQGEDVLNKPIGLQQYEGSLENERHRDNPRNRDEQWARDHGDNADADAIGPDNPFPGEPGGPTAGHYPDDGNENAEGRPARSDDKDKDKNKDHDKNKGHL